MLQRLIDMLVRVLHLPRRKLDAGSEQDDNTYPMW